MSKSRVPCRRSSRDGRIDVVSLHQCYSPLMSDVNTKKVRPWRPLIRSFQGHAAPRYILRLSRRLVPGLTSLPSVLSCGNSSPEGEGSMRLKNNLLLSLAMVLASAACLAQTTATIVGTVTDSTGAVVPGVLSCGNSSPEGEGSMRLKNNLLLSLAM